MTPIATLERGEYRLINHVCNPCGSARADDWRLKDAWQVGAKFRCFDVYTFSGRTVPALYLIEQNKPGNMVHESCMPEVFHLLLPYLERV